MDEQNPKYQIAEKYREIKGLFFYLFLTWGGIMNILTILSIVFLGIQQDTRMIVVFICCYAIYLLVFTWIFVFEDKSSENFDSLDKGLRNNKLCYRRVDGYQAVDNMDSIQLKSQPSSLTYKLLKVTIVDEEQQTIGDQKNYFFEGRVNYLNISPDSLVPKLVYFILVILALGTLVALIMFPRKEEVVEYKVKLKKEIAKEESNPVKSKNELGDTSLKVPRNENNFEGQETNPQRQIDQNSNRDTGETNLKRNDENNNANAQTDQKIQNSNEKVESEAGYPDSVQEKFIRKDSSYAIVHDSSSQRQKSFTNSKNRDRPKLGEESKNSGKFQKNDGELSEANRYFHRKSNTSDHIKDEGIKQ